MDRIFLSYSREDFEAAERIVALLQAEGLEVWWLEGSIPPGVPYREAMEEAQERADRILVLWSAASVRDDLVRAQADRARASGHLLPVAIERVLLPPGFDDIHTLDLAGWDGSFQAAEAQMLLCLLLRLNPLFRCNPLPAFLPRAAREPDFPSVSDEDRPTILAPQRQKDADVDCLDILSDEPDPQAVMLAVAAPRRAPPGSSFSARFAAYVEAARESAKRHLEDLGEQGDRVVLDLPPDRQPHWRIGAPVTVRLSGPQLTVSPAERSFEWNGRENILSFAVSVAAEAPATRVQLCFQVFLGPVEISVINLGVELGAGAGVAPPHAETARMPSSAFASYASRDAAQVAQRLSTLAHWAPSLDIFQDCLDLTPNENFKPQLAKQIAAREVFLLFWSRNAQASQWVRWELDTARARPGLDAILPMPLEDPAVAPPPPGFEDRHLRDRYLIAGYGLGKIAEEAAASPQV